MSAVIYLDTSFFTGLLENEANRRQDALNVATYEEKEGSHLYTSQLTINEFLVKTFNKYLSKDEAECDQRVEETIRSINDIASFVSINEDILKNSARLMSVWGKLRKEKLGKSPRDRKFRWDSIHLATADFIRADRVYAFDGPWNDVPKTSIPRVKQIICPAKVEQPSLPNLSD